MNFNSVFSLFSLFRRPEIDKRFIGELHQAAQNLGSLEAHNYLVILDGKLGWSTKKSEEVSLEVLTKFANEKLKGLPKEQAKQVVEDLDKIGAYKAKFSVRKDELKEAMSFLGLQDIASSSMVSKSWNKDINLEEDPRMWKTQLKAMAFGPEKWETHFGDVGEVPPLPKNILEEMMKPCGFWPGKRVGETHMLVLIPATINGELLTIKSFRELVKKPKEGNKTDYEHIADQILIDFGDTPIEKSHWVLMTKDVIPWSRGEGYAFQKALVTAEPDYQVPNLLDAIVLVLTDYVSTGVEQQILERNKMTKEVFRFDITG